MDAKEQAREIWDKVSAWGTAKIGELSFMEQLAIATEPGKKAALLDEERSYAEALISSALSAQAAEVDRLRGGIKRARDQIESFGLHFLSLKIYPEYDRALRCMIDCDTILPPDAPEPTP